jgi:hypothetical protein
MPTPPTVPNDPGIFSGAFGVVFAIVAAIVVIGGAFVVFAAVRNARAAKRAGHDPLTMQTKLAARALDSDLLKPADARSVEERLAELDALAARGVITAAERDSARRDILAG